ncbi:alpha/beta hydrolase [Sulfitobacter noctilucicola]|nr:alpha/beta fold hydrolase [Sulfitobacter noctilucicola]
MIVRLLLVLLTVCTLASCAPRGVIAVAEPAPDSRLHDIWVASFRATVEPEAGQTLPPRPKAMTFERQRIAVPPTHQTGQIEWPKGLPEPAKNFVTADTAYYESIGAFSNAVRAADLTATGNTFLFVHGYNYTHGEAVYQMAQIAHDFEIPSPPVLFSWPSAARAAGYLYDRDSVLIARDQLEDLIVALTRSPDRKLIIMGHSMGTFLLMETLRQIEISGSVDIPAKVESLILVSPDIDGELFYTQAARLSKLPDPSLIIAAKQDKVLRLSAFLTGRTNRLGSETDRGAVGDLPITVVDASNLGTNGTNHSIALTSPTAITILKNLRRQSNDISKTVPSLVHLSELR